MRGEVEIRFFLSTIRSDKGFYFLEVESEFREPLFFEFASRPDDVRRPDFHSGGDKYSDFRRTRRLRTFRDLRAMAGATPFLHGEGRLFG
jgi:hypothetical protein